MKLYVPLTLQEFDILDAVARAERRTPQDQAAYALAKFLTDVAAVTEGPEDGVGAEPAHGTAEPADTDGCTS